MEEKPLDALCLGESLVDLIGTGGTTLLSVTSFRKAIGGAPTNVAVGLARRARQVGVVGSIGDDPFGAFLRGALRTEGVKTESLHTAPQGATGFTFVAIDERGEPSFSAPPVPFVDRAFAPGVLERAPLERARFVIAGSNQMMQPESRARLLAALARARAAGAIVLFDVNLRLHLWDDAQSAHEACRRACALADIIKVNEAERAAIAPGRSARDWFANDLASAGTRALVTTRGAQGAEVELSGGSIKVGARPAHVVDATGAGDAFVAGLVDALLDAKARDLTQIEEAAWRRVLDEAARAGAEAVERLGAL